MMLTGLVVVIGYSTVYWPLSNDIAETQTRLGTAQKRLQLTRDIESLRIQFKRCQPRLSEKPDTNEWVQYLLSGLRKLPVQLHAMDFKPLKEVGPYKAIALRIEVEGSFDDLHAVLCWLETNKRLFRRKCWYHAASARAWHIDDGTDYPWHDGLRP